MSNGYVQYDDEMQSDTCQMDSLRDTCVVCMGQSMSRSEKQWQINMKRSNQCQL